MQIHAKRNSLTLIILALCVVALQTASAQNFGRPAGNGNGGQQPAAAAPNAAGNNTDVSSGAAQIDSSVGSSLDYLFNHKAQDGTAAKSAQDATTALTDRMKAIAMFDTPGFDDPATRARFETYISLKEVSDARIKEYFGKMKLISQMLKAGDLIDAHKMLYDLSDYTDLDAGISSELAAHIETFWNTENTAVKLARDNEVQQQAIEKANFNIDTQANGMTLSQSNQQLKNGGSTKSQAQGGNANNQNQNQNNTNQTNNPHRRANRQFPLLNVDADPVAAEQSIMPTFNNALAGKADLTNEYFNLLSAHAQITMNDIKAHKMSDLDRMNFSDYIRTLYNSHRYYHVILAADFYRTMFNEGDYPQDVVNQAVSSSGTTGRMGIENVQQLTRAAGINPRGAVNGINGLSNVMGEDKLGGTANQPLSIADEVTAALEINGKVDQNIEAFKYKAGLGKISSASTELQDAFVANEFHPGLKGLAREEKEKVGNYLDLLDTLKKQIAVRQFEKVDAQITDIKKIATDFDDTEPMALVNGIKLESRLRLGKAQLLAQQDQLTEAMEEFQTAGEEWPGNPDLSALAGKFFTVKSDLNESTTEFDRLVQEQNDREIYDKKLEFALAVKGDATREQQLKDALIKVQKAEMASEKANALATNGDISGAWETVEIAAKDWPDDVKLNKLLANYSGRSADFVSALNKARDAEAKKELGYSLTWYVNAQGYYPASVIANDGITRVSKELLSPNPASSDNSPDAPASPRLLHA